MTTLQLFHLQEALSNLDDYDKTCVESALQGVNSVVQQEWGNACPCQVSEPNWSNVNSDFSVQFMFAYLLLYPAGGASY